MAGCFLSVQALFLTCLFWGAWLSCITSANQDTCGHIRYLKFFDREYGLYMYLQGHTFLNLSIGAGKSCETECLYRRECVAINIGPAINDMRVCELCNSDHIQHPNDLKRRERWTYKGTQNICAYKPCLNNAKCFLGYTDKGFLCECQSGYTGELCGTDLDECKDKTHQCDVNANCTNIPGSYNCTCRPGYTGNGSICNEIDECKDGSHDCHINANCTNIPGSYNCTCRPGYQGNGSICKDINECEEGSHDCNKNANCTNTAGSYNCTCRPGYTGNGSICEGPGLNASTILGNDSRYLENLTLFLEPVINSSVRSRFVRCWHAKEDGWAASTFHGNCDDKGPTVTIIQVGSFIFGGYSDVSWKIPGPHVGCSSGYSRKAFMYSLTNNNGSGHAVYNPVKLRVKSDKDHVAVYSCDFHGPVFGPGDIQISDNSASNQHSRTYCGRSYPLPPGYSLSGSNCTFYAGSYRFTPTDIEVFYETTT